MCDIRPELYRKRRSSRLAGEAEMDEVGLAIHRKVMAMTDEEVRAELVKICGSEDVLDAALADNDV